MENCSIRGCLEEEAQVEERNPGVVGKWEGQRDEPTLIEAD